MKPFHTLNSTTDNAQCNKNDPDHDQSLADGMRLEPLHRNHFVERDLAFSSTRVNKREPGVRHQSSGSPHCLFIV
jgi:hypothetical protein